MRSISRRFLIQQAKDFYKDTKYIPSNYDALFHTDYFSSPVTIRKYFGSWDKYLDSAFDAMIMDSHVKMFYGGYNTNYSVTLPDILDPNILIGNMPINILGKLTYDELLPREAWVLKSRWMDIVTVISSMDITFTVISAEKKFLTPYLGIDDKYIIGSFDTPHIKNHFKRTSKLIEHFNKNYELLNFNGVKKNHMKKAIERLME